ncbi:class I SAM-dependent methyltransferase [Ramlibacter tataouinensis]|uniref:Methyltransferase domain-containing protein n=1 Tax=Ramlibacter tataouinensis (strain ATCC BAA-407 / DSM 14655 / LMG 21543 / TTB310) TaxID=365046 RepID=F5XXC0_RAMTT|nr:class I SAM-dependent methyltransferase [Ramlibacter tataouinensis]AEG94255.1 conserved hypothetical protein [Ramlibacter tataouinensis TTB310]
MLYDPWLDRWLPLLTQQYSGELVLDIGCGHGDDLRTLARAGFRVMGFDRSAVAVALARRRVPGARIEHTDFRERFAVGVPSLGVVVASLSLHYYPWEETLALVAKIRSALRPGGLLLCRLNSTTDRHFGAGRGDEIEPNLFLIDGHPKRFFDEESVSALFSKGWKTLSIQQLHTRKYLRQKALWEVVLERSAN